MAGFELTPSHVANLAEIIGAGATVTGLVFGWIQLRHDRVQRRDEETSAHVRHRDG